MSEEVSAETTETTDTSGAAGEQAQNLGDGIAAAAKEVSEDSTESEDSEDATASEDGGSEDSEEGQPSGAPDSYSDFEVPEGLTWSDDDTALFTEQMQGLGASQEQAQAMLEYVATHVNDRVLPGLKEQQDAEYAKLIEQGTQAAKDDPILGGESGELLEQNQKLSARVLDMVQQDLNKAGIKSNVTDALLKEGDLHSPALMHVLVWAGKRTLPDALDGPGDGGGKSDTWEDTPPEDRMGWDDNANPIGNRKSA